LVICLSRNLCVPNQAHLDDDDLRRYAREAGLDLGRFEVDWPTDAVASRIARDFEGGLASDEILGTPTLYIDGQLFEGGYDAHGLIEALGATA
jgi:hypothetical protein